MKVTPRRNRSDSAAAAIAASQAAALGPLTPPSHVTLRPGDLPFWNAIMQARARDTWTETDLATAVTLARTKADIQKLQIELDAEGFTYTNGKGVMMLNPKRKLIESMARLDMSLSRILHVHAEATVGKSRDSVNALNNERQASLDLDDEDDLIPRLRLVG